jgi:DNA-binding CsgD family transcriptional regulator
MIQPLQKRREPAPKLTLPISPRALHGRPLHKPTTHESLKSRFVNPFPASREEKSAKVVLVDGLFSNLEKSPITCATFVVARTIREGFVDGEMRRRFALVVPHIRRAMLVGKVIDLKTVEAAALADSLDTLSSAMFLVDATGRIVHANFRGHIMLSEARVVCAPGGKLHAIDQQAHQALLDSFTAAGSGDTVMGRKGIAVPLSARDGERYVAHVLPLTCGSRRKAGVCYAAVATVFINKAALDLPSPPEAISRAFQLTPTELRVLFAVIEVGSAPEVAEVLGISEATVKWHLRHCLRRPAPTDRRSSSSSSPASPIRSSADPYPLRRKNPLAPSDRRGPWSTGPATLGDCRDRAKVSFHTQSNFKKANSGGRGTGPTARISREARKCELPA